MYQSALSGVPCISISDYLFWSTEAVIEKFKRIYTTYSIKFWTDVRLHALRRLILQVVTLHLLWVVNSKCLHVCCFLDCAESQSWEEMTSIYTFFMWKLHLEVAWSRCLAAPFFIHYLLGGSLLYLYVICDEISALLSSPSSVNGRTWFHSLDDQQSLERGNVDWPFPSLHWNGC